MAINQDNVFSSGSAYPLPIAPARIDAYVEAEAVATLCAQPKTYSPCCGFFINTPWGFYDRLALDLICEKHTMFRRFQDLVGAPNYWPYFNLQTARGMDYVEQSVLAQAYDAAQRARGDSRRAHVWRGV